MARPSLIWQVKRFLKDLQQAADAAATETVHAVKAVAALQKKLKAKEAELEVAEAELRAVSQVKQDRKADQDAGSSGRRRK